VLHFFTGTHGDYHRPSDDWEKINISGTERVVDMIEKLVVEVASQPERPAYIAVKGTADIEERSGSRPYFGSVPDFGADQPGYALAGVAPDGPAEKAGLRAGDRIVQLGAHKIGNLSDFDGALRRFAPGETVDVAIIRGEERVTLKVVLGMPR
jgi:S1-C subfamily serine protease